MSKLFPNKILLLLFSIFVIQQVYPHPMGLTFSNLNYSKGVLSLSTRIFYADFYYEFQKTATNKNKDYVKSGIDNTDKKDLVKYFKKNIRIWSDNKEVHFDTISFAFERHEEDAYIFVVKFKGKAKIQVGSKIKILYSVLLTTIGGQKQIINVFLKDGDVPSHGIITLDKATPFIEFINN
ncbi:MAG: hypothetical protein PHS84_11700 [Paludibacter sp.]|nr:hypothetical protein [Paludibacter sp.]